MTKSSLAACTSVAVVLSVVPPETPFSVVRIPIFA